MKKLILTFIFPILANAQYYKATSNLFSTNKDANNLDIGVNYEFKNIQYQGLYNINKKFSAFATLNFNKTTTYYTQFLWGGQRAIDTDNSGYSFGVLLHKNGQVGLYKNLEFLLGYENQDVLTADYSVSYYSGYKNYLKEKYYKIFLQFNMTKIRKYVDLGYSCKLSYLQFIDYQYYDFFSNGGFAGKGTLMLDPTFNFNLKPDGNKNLKLTSQIGFSAALNTMKDYQDYGNGSYSSTEIYLYSATLKVGIQYQFNLKKTKS